MESVLDHDRILTTPIKWGKFWGTAAILLLYLGLYLGIDAAPNNPGRIPFVIILIILAGDAFVCGIHYTISKKHLIVNWMYFPLRKIPWVKVAHAGYIHIWKEARPFYTTLERGFVSGQIIYVTLKGCPAYRPQEEVRAYHNWRHPFLSLCIWLPRETKYEYINLFKAYYPALEIQPVDERKKF